MDFFGKRLSPLSSLAHHSGDVIAQRGRNLAEGRGQGYGPFEETGLDPEQDDQQPKKDLDNTDLLVEYEGVTRDGALQLSFDYDRHHHHQQPHRHHKSPRHEQQVQDKSSIAGTEAAQSDLQGSVSSQRSPVPKLTIVMMVTGTRGDVQPFLVRLFACKAAQAAHNYASAVGALCCFSLSCGMFCSICKLLRVVTSPANPHACRSCALAPQQCAHGSNRT